MAGYEGKIQMVLVPQLLQKNLQLINPAHSSYFLFAFYLVQSFAGGQRKARVALERISDFGEVVVVEGLTVLKRVLNQLEQDAA